MQLTVHLLAFGTDVPAPVRVVSVPEDQSGGDNDHLLDMAFYWGQNDFQPQRVRSVSVGDVVALPDGSHHRVLGVGFERVPEDVDLASLERGIACSLL